MILLEKFVMALIIIMLVYLCLYAVINRICKCIEHYTDQMYRSQVGNDCLNNYQPPKSHDDYNRREED